MLSGQLWFRWPQVQTEFERLVIDQHGSLAHEGGHIAALHGFKLRHKPVAMLDGHPVVEAVFDPSGEVSHAGSNAEVRHGLACQGRSLGMVSLLDGLGALFEGLSGISCTGDDDGKRGTITCQHARSLRNVSD